MLSITVLVLSLGMMAEPADLVVVNARIWTLKANQPDAEALAIRGDRFVAVGSKIDLQPLIGPKTKVLDLGGQVVLPGFIDAHAHPRPVYSEDSRWYVVEAGPESVKSMEELIAAIKRKARITPKGVPIRGSGYQDTKLGRHPTRQDLDQATTDHPVYISHSSGHLSVCNSLALKLAKVDKNTPDPKGGAFARDANGEPNGLLKESAGSKVRSALPSIETPESERLAGLKNCFKQFAEQGITGVHVAGTDPASARSLAQARAEGYPIRLYIMLREGSIAEAVKLKEAMPIDEWGVRYGAIKFFHGNSLSGQTAWLYEPYAHQADYFGLAPARSRTDLFRLVKRIHEAGLQACIHANGDREIDTVLDAYAEAFQQKPDPKQRHRIEHCSVVNPSILKRIKELGLVVAPHSYIYEHGDKMENFGAARWPWMHANRSMIDQGTVVAGNSDYPVSAAIPMLRIHDMVNRTSAEGKVYGPQQRCTVEQSVHAFTLGSAYAEFAEQHKGSIEVGKLADFVVLNRDPRTVEPMKLKDISVLRTVIGGQTVFERK